MLVKLFTGIHHSRLQRQFPFQEFNTRFKTLLNDDIVLVTPSDHLIKDQKAYENALKKAIDYAKKDFLVTFSALRLHKLKVIQI